MTDDTERNLGEQPIAKILETLEIKVNALVEISTEQITHKMIHRACKGRRLSKKVQRKILTALNAVSGKNNSHGDLFNY